MKAKIKSIKDKIRQNIKDWKANGKLKNGLSLALVACFVAAVMTTAITFAEWIIDELRVGTVIAPAFIAILLWCAIQVWARHEARKRRRNRY